MAGPTVNPFRRSFLYAALSFLVVAALVVAAFPGLRDEPDLLAELGVRLLLALVIAGACMGFVARSSARAWSHRRFALMFALVLGIAVVIEVGAVVAQVQSAHRQAPR